MEALIHNLNTMNSRAGAQTPFSSINYGTDTSPEGRMVIKNVLLAQEAGLGNGETPIFPIHIFKIKEGMIEDCRAAREALDAFTCDVALKTLKVEDLEKYDITPKQAAALEIILEDDDEPEAEEAPKEE
jgi:ribonucleoside-triphosphate reductase